jgi:hypothetical protein
MSKVFFSRAQWLLNLAVKDIEDGMMNDECAVVSRVAVDGRSVIVTVWISILGCFTHQYFRF